MTLRPALIVLGSLILAALRIWGVKDPIFQALAHLWVGLWLGWGVRRERDRTAIGAAVGLTAVEVICFAAMKLGA